MASFAAKQGIKHLLEKAGCSKEKAEKVGNIAKIGTFLATGDIAGLVADRVYTKYKANKDYVIQCRALCQDDIVQVEHDSDEEEEAVEVKGSDQEEHHAKHLDRIRPFLVMASEAYKKVELADKFPQVLKRSKLICGVERPAKLLFSITTATTVHVCVMHDGTLVFAFRGTKVNDTNHPLSDILTDFNQTQVPVKYYNASEKVAYEAPSSVKAHKGFMLAFQDVTQTPREDENLRLVAEGLGASAAQVKKVVCTGHSLGGALATLCAHWCRHVAYKEAQIWCVTIGSPRVGNRAFAKDFNKNVTQRKNSYRVVNKGDLVPWMPHLGMYPKVWTAYKHVEGFIHLSEHPTRQNTVCVKRGGCPPIWIVPSLIDHKCNAYAVSIDKVLATLYKYGLPRLTHELPAATN